MYVAGIVPSCPAQTTAETTGNSRTTTFFLQSLVHNLSFLAGSVVMKTLLALGLALALYRRFAFSGPSQARWYTSGSQDKGTEPVGVLQFQGRSSAAPGIQMAVLAVATALPALVCVVFRRQLVRGTVQGAVKG